MRKNLRHLRNLRDKKKRPKKNLCKSMKSVGQKTPMKKSVKSVGLFPVSGVSATTGQVASAKSA